MVVMMMAAEVAPRSARPRQMAGWVLTSGLDTRREDSLYLLIKIIRNKEKEKKRKWYGMAVTEEGDGLVGPEGPGTPKASHEKRIPAG